MNDIRQTGVRNYERITSSPKGKRCQGTIMILRRYNGIPYPPSREFVSKLTTTDIRDKLSLYEYFEYLTPEERYTYLMSNAVGDKDLYMSNIHDLYVKFEAIHFYTAKKGENELSEEIMNTLMLGNPNDSEGFWPLNYVFNLFSRRDTSTTKRHTLVFRPSNWMLMEKTKEIPVNYTGLICSLPSGKCDYNTTNTGYPFEKICITVESKDQEVTNDQLINIAYQLLPSNDYPGVLNKLKGFAPSFYKSLLQKIIRYRPLVIDSIDAKVWLLCTFIVLYTHPGALVPDLQRFVSGREGAVKRLAVIIMEDSQTSDTEAIYSMLGFALLESNKVKYSVSHELAKRWMRAALDAYTSSNYYKYATNSTEIFPSCSWLNALLSTIGSFRSDISLVSTIEGYIVQEVEITGDMPMYHAVDQHCFPSIAWYIDSYLPYTELFRMIWDNVSSLNPRKPKSYDNIIFTEVRNAQRLLLLARNIVPINREIIPGSHSFTYELKDEYLAAVVGILEVKNTIAVIVPSDVHEFRAARKPSKDPKEYILTEEEYTEAVDTLRLKLYDGIPVSDEFITKVYYRDSKYYVESRNNVIEWEQFKNLRFEFSLHAAMEKTLENAIRYTGIGVEESASITANEDVVRRLLLYSNKKHVKPYKISRDGNGTDYGVSPLDTRVYRLLADISLLYPAALSHSPKDGFEVKHKQLFSHVIDGLKNADTYTIGIWKTPGPETRKLYDHQINAISQLKQRNIIWMAPGMGKTAIIMSHISNLIASNQMPLYCVYTLPKPAWENIRPELENRGIPYVLEQLKPNCVSVIYHDTLRKIIGDLRKHASSMLFVIDEFHNTLNPTQRTSAALEIATLAWSFIAMTGTLYKDDKVEYLFPWLQLLYSFEITAKNYWVAIAGIISIRCDTNVKTERIVVEEPLNIEELEEYKFVTPSILGGTSLKLNFRKAVEISNHAITRGMVKQIHDYLRIGEGVFVVADNMKHAEELKKLIGIDSIQMLTGKNPLSYNPSSTNAPWVVITTPTHREGYDMTKYRVMVSGVYFSNEATRTQLERRINRVNQTSPTVRVIIVHAGILSYIHENYNGVRNMASALDGFKKNSGVEIE